MADKKNKEGQDGEKKKGGKLKLIIIILVALLLLGGGGFAGYMFFMGDEEPLEEELLDDEELAEGEEGAAGAEGEEGKEKPPDKTIVNFEPFVVNLADPTGKRYLKLAMAVDAKDVQAMDRLTSKMPQIRDGILVLLSSKSYADISTVSGKIRLRNEILKVFNRIMTGTQGIHAVYFTEFVIQ